MAHPNPALFQNALDLYVQRPTRENAMILLYFIGEWLVTGDAAAMGVCAALMEILNERNQFRKNFIARFFQKWMPGFIHRRFPAHRLGWNDYYMARWQLTKERSAAEEIHRRVAHLKAENEDWSLVVFTATWMANSQRQYNPEFDAQMLTIEQECALCHAGGA